MSTAGYPTEGSSANDEEQRRFEGVDELAMVETTSTCGCGGDCGGSAAPTADDSAVAADSEDGTPVLDARAIPHSVRHATVIGAYTSRPFGESLILVAPHDPKPLLKQLAARTEDRVTVAYEVSGPDAWRLRLTRHAC